MNNLSWKNFKKNFRSYLPAILILAFGIALINGVLKIQKQVNDQLHNNASGIQTVVGAKGSPIQLVLANIYHMDDPTGNIPLDEAEELANNPMMAKALPLAYGDNHQGYKLLGTNLDYVNHFGGEIIEGKYMEKPLEVMVGHDVAKKLNIDIGYTFQSIHGSGHKGHVHAENTYKVVGILNRTGNVLDKLLITSIASFWKTHNIKDLDNRFDKKSFAKAKELNKELNHHHHDHKGHDHSAHNHDDHHHHEGHDHSKEHKHEESNNNKNANKNQEKQITALLLSFKGSAGFFMINQINQSENLMAVNPAQVILKFFTVLGVGYTTITAIAWAILSISIVTLMLTLIQVFSNRKYELALLRVMGASKTKLASTLLSEVVIIVLCGFVLGTIFTVLSVQWLANSVDQNIFNGFDWQSLGINEFFILLVCLVCGMISVSIPLIRVYKIDLSKTLSDEK